MSTPSSDQLVPRRTRRAPATVTANACTACRYKRAKCDGNSPCVRCITSKVSSSCTYVTHSRLVKTAMQFEIGELHRQIGELREANTASTEVLDALRSDQNVPKILGLLQNQQSLISIAEAVDISKNIETHSSIRSLPGTTESWKQETSITHSGVATAQHALPSVLDTKHCWITESQNQYLIKHLLCLYWIWIHPACPLFNIEILIHNFMAGLQGHASTFLIAAVCAAACDLLTPIWITTLVPDSDVAVLQSNFIAEANSQQALADVNDPTVLLALQVMKIVNLRAVAASAGSFELSRLDLKQQEPDVRKILNWLNAVRLPGP